MAQSAQEGSQTSDNSSHIPASLVAHFAAERRRDRRNFFFAGILALLLHLPILALVIASAPLPLDALTYERSVYVIQEVRFRPPQLKNLIPKPLARRFSIPDPSPDHGEISDLVFGIPDAPAYRAEEPPIQVGHDALYGSATTGGTAEPNDAPYGDMFFQPHDTNPFVDTEDDALSTFGLDVDTGSYTIVRNYLQRGHLPPPEAIRVEEMINYFKYPEAPPTEDDFAVLAEVAPAIFGENERYQLLRFHLLGRELTAPRPAADLTFVIDVSGSMAQENRLGLVKRSLFLLLDQLRRDDRLALVIYGSRGQVMLEPTGDHHAMRQAIESLRTMGSTNAEEGLRLAYQLAAEHRRKGTIHRVILCSDGVANVGRASADSIFETIRSNAEAGIELTTVGFGMGNYNDALMERLADIGDGRYAYVDNLKEAQRIFVHELTGTLVTIASEARVQVEFNPTLVDRYRLLGYENRAIVDERFRDDTVDAGEIGAGHSVTALYEIKLRRHPTSKEALATLHLRYQSQATGKMVESAHPVTGTTMRQHWEEASTNLRLAALVAEFGEILKGSYWAQKGDLNNVFERLQNLTATERPGEPALAELENLARQASKLWQAKNETVASVNPSF